MLLAPLLGEKPRDVAARLGEAVAGRLGRPARAGRRRRARLPEPLPGRRLVRATRWPACSAAGDGLRRRRRARSRERVNVEFVSANPTGPIHLGHARNAAYGDAICRLLAFHGHDVAREFYVNDAGAQIAQVRARRSRRGRAARSPRSTSATTSTSSPQQIPGAATMDLDELGRAGHRARARRDAGDAGALPRRAVRHLVLRGVAVRRVADRARARARSTSAAQTYRRRRTRCGCARPTTATTRTACSSSPTARYTYMASGHRLPPGQARARLRPAASTSGAPTTTATCSGRRRPSRRSAATRDELELLIMQFVNLVRGGEPVSMSKRAGEFITLDELIDEIGTDAARWYLLARSHDTTIEVDLDLATRESADNPVYYVQYAHARIAKILASASAARRPPSLAGAARARRAGADQEAGRVPGARWPRPPTGARRTGSPPTRSTSRATSRSSTSTCKVVGSEQRGVPARRCAPATQRVIARSLDLLGVDAPDVRCRPRRLEVVEVAEPELVEAAAGPRC